MHRPAPCSNYLANVSRSSCGAARKKDSLSPIRRELRNYHSATYASRNGLPLEVISEVILRHQDLKTTQAYPGRISEAEALHWMDVLHER